MRKLALIIMVAMSSGIATFSQTLSSGYYRVQNDGSKHYVFINDCTGSASSTATQDLDAVELWKWDDNILSDPGSVMYIDVAWATEIQTHCDITSQNTGIKQMINDNIDAYPVGTNIWQLYYGGSYLLDIGKNKSVHGAGWDTDRTYIYGGDMTGLSEYSVWVPTPLSSSTSNYFGFKPTVTTTSGKYYAPFYAAFAYTPVSSNVKTWYVSKIDKTRGVAVISEITGTVAASQPVIIECVGSTAASNKANPTKNTGNTASSTNLLKGTYFCNGERAYKTHSGDKALVKFDAKTMRVLGLDDNGNLAFVSDNSKLTTYNVTSTKIYKSATTVAETANCIPHNHSYLVVDNDCPATLKIMTAAEYANIVPGDANNDGVLDKKDVDDIVNYSIQKSTTINTTDADMNKDNKVNVTDATLVIKKLQGK